MMEKQFYQVGQRPQEWMRESDAETPLDRHRLPFMRRHLLKWRAAEPPRRCGKNAISCIKRPLWWTIALGLLALSAPFMSNTALTIAAIFCMCNAIHLLWTLIIGTAGIFSLTTLWVLGIGACVAAAMNVYLGPPWPFMFLAGGLAGLIAGGFLALPSTRLNGLYDALLTMGFAKICRVFVQQLKSLSAMNGSINRVDSFIPDALFLQRPGLLLGFAGAFI